MSGLSTERTSVGVVGGGAWGTALAVHCARMGHQVLLWALEPEASSAYFTQQQVLPDQHAQAVGTCCLISLQTDSC
jgi:glycerol-3-phosphate dehydrogenase